MLISLNNQYVAPAHIVEVVAHPVARDVCVILSTGREIRVPMDPTDTPATAVERVARHIKTKAGI